MRRPVAKKTTEQKRPIMAARKTSALPQSDSDSTDDQASLYAHTYNRPSGPGDYLRSTDFAGKEDTKILYPCEPKIEI